MAGWQSRKVSGFMAKTARKGKKMGAKDAKWLKVLDTRGGKFLFLGRGLTSVTASQMWEVAVQEWVGCDGLGI